MSIISISKFTIGENSYGLPYLKKLAKEAHPEYFDEGLELLEQYFKPDYKDIRIIKEDCRYLSLANSPHENNIFAREQLILLRAHLGYGKTTAILRLIERNEYKRVLFLSPRITFSQFISTEFGTEFYLDENADLTADRLTISVESLCKLKGGDPYDCVILDECEAILSVFSSPTLRGRQIDTFNLLGDFIRASKKTVFAGAFITQKTIDFILSFNLPAVCVWNTNPPRPKKAVQYHKDIFVLKVAESMAAGNKNYYLYSSLTALNSDFAKLKGMSNPVIQNILENTLIYSSESDDKMVRKTLANIHKYWGKAASIATTPTITVGNSYSPEIPDVVGIFINAAPTCTVADTFQGHERARRTKSDTLYFCLPPEKHLNLAKSLSKLKFEILRNYDQHNQQKYQQTLNLITELIQCEKKQYIQRDTTGQYISRLEYFAEELGNKITPPALKQLMMFNFMEQTLSNCYYEEMFFRFLTLNNYTIVSRAAQSTKEENAAKEKIDSGAVECVVNYSDIPLVMPETLEHLKYKQTHKDASRLEKLEIARYFFDELIDHNIPEEAKQHYFTQYLSSHENKYLRNLHEEIKGNVKHTVLNKLNPDAATECISMMPIQLNYVLTLNKALGVPNTSIGHIVISREKIAALNDYVRSEYENINTAFGFAKLKNTEKWEFKHTHNMIQKIYKSWSKYELVLTKKDRDKKALEYTTRSDIIYECTDGAIPPFTPPAPPQETTTVSGGVPIIIDSIEQKIKLCLEQSTNEVERKIDVNNGKLPEFKYDHSCHIKNFKQGEHSSSHRITTLLM
jgi:hypothetical protein